MSTRRILRAAAAAVGEGPLWDGARGVVWWVDIKGCRLHRTCPAEPARDAAWDLPGQPGCLGTCADGMLLLAMQEGLWRFDPVAGVLSPPLPFETDRPGNRSNDGKPGPDGAFWVGTMPDAWQGRATGGLWRLRPGMAPRRVLDNVGCANALCWSPDRRTLYFADSRRRQLLAHSFDVATGAVGEGRLLADFATLPGLPQGAVPDGATVDAAGRIWIAVWDGGCVLVLTPDGQVATRLDLPARRPTCPAFGGAGLATLFVTSARFGLATPGEADGALLTIEGTGAFGLPEPCLDWPSGQPPRLPAPTEVP
jgi:sugar lactone lactonase YvrE